MYGEDRKARVGHGHSQNAKSPKKFLRTDLKTFLRMLLQRDERYFETLTELFLFFPGNIIGGIPPRQRRLLAALRTRRVLSTFFKSAASFSFSRKKERRRRGCAYFRPSPFAG